MTIPQLRAVRFVVETLAAGRGVDHATSASGLTLARVREIHETYGPTRDRLLVASHELLKEINAREAQALDDRPKVVLPPSERPSPRPPVDPSAEGRAGFTAARVPTRLITPHPSNINRNLGDLRDLAASIKTSGVRVPVVLERRVATYRLRDGHRRVAAAKMAKVATVPAVVHAEALDDREWLLESIDYNLRRQGYTEEDKRRVARQLRDLGVTPAGIAAAFNLSPGKTRLLLTDVVTSAADAPPKAKRAPTTVSRKLVGEKIAELRGRPDLPTLGAGDILDLLEAALQPPQEPLS